MKKLPQPFWIIQFMQTLQYFAENINEFTLRFSDCETNLHSVLGVRIYWGTVTGLLFKNDTFVHSTCIIKKRTTVSKNMV